MIKLLLATALLVVTFSTLAQVRATGEVVFSTDSDDTTVENYLIGGGHRGNKFDFDILVGTLTVTDFAQDDLERVREFDQAKLKLSYRASEKYQAFGWLSRIQGDSYNAIIGEGSLVYVPNRTWRFEAGTGRSIVDSINAIDSIITVTSNSASVDWNFANDWTATASTVQQLFSDENTKSTYVARLIKTSSWLYGLNYQGYYRFSDSDFNPAQYFAPQSQHRAMAGIGYNRAFLNDKFLFRSTVLYGKQWDDFTDSKALELKLSVRGYVTDNFYSSVDYIYTNDNGNINSGVDYWYEVFYINLHYYF